jgi:hypothetical protein
MVPTGQIEIEFRLCASCAERTGARVGELGGEVPVYAFREELSGEVPAYVSREELAGRRSKSGRSRLTMPHFGGVFD